MKRLLLAILIFFAISAISFAGQFKVVRVTDGDTIKVENKIKTSIIRLVGIDAPETSKKKNEAGQPFSQKSTKHLASLVLNKSVEIKSYVNDRYGRILGIDYVDGKNVNLEMVKAGLAEVYRGQPSSGFDNDPDWKAEQEAREAGRGMGSLGDRYVRPREWRKMQKE
jgi:micrococcal nuclease